jgi:putative ABC transport system permease protein
MSLWTRITNVFRRDRLRDELDEEMQLHLEEAIENGRDPAEVRRAFGSLLRRREDSQDIKLSTWLDSLRSDAAFGWRQLLKNRVVSSAAVLSLALAIGSCTAAFRLIDALLLRPLPVTAPDRLYYLEYEFKDRTGKVDRGDSFEYPVFRTLRAAVKDEAELMAISYSSPIDITYGSDQEMEKVHRQYVSGWTFGTFGLKPALGRLLTSADDEKPDAHPYAVLSYDYWTRRFAKDPKVIGKTLRSGSKSFEIVGVAEKGFTGTETGTITDLFVPTMMNGRAINNPNWGWFRAWAQTRPGVRTEAVEQKLRATLHSYRAELVKGWPSGIPKHEVENYINAPVLLEQASAGASGLQKNYRRPLMVLSAVVLLVLLIACANVANLMTAQATSRAKEMALRVSIGAGRFRLLQLVLVESAFIAWIATTLGALFAWWSAPLVVSMIGNPGDPVQLVLPADWRVLGFAAGLAMLVTMLFGIVPAIRASGVKPMAVLRGGDSPHSRRRVLNVLTAAQVTFCFLVLFVTGLFVTTFERISNQPLGFNPDRVITVEAVAKTAQPFVVWSQAADHLRSVGGIEAVGISSWALMSGNGWRSGIYLNGQPQNQFPSPYFLGVSSKWLESLRITLIDGRDFRPEDMSPAKAIVNESFAKRYFDGKNPVGQTIQRMEDKKLVPVEIVGLVRDARYRDMREEIQPTLYVPFQSLDKDGQPKKEDWATFTIRTANQNPMQLASVVRQEIPRIRPELRVSDIQTQHQLVRIHTIRERVLAVLSTFFAIVALILAGVGLFGVINYGMLQRRREIGIRMALGARAGDVAQKVTAESFMMLLVGGIAGLACGYACSSLIESLLFGVKASDPALLTIPAIVLLATALLAAIPPVIQAIRLDPSTTLRSE